MPTHSTHLLRLVAVVLFGGAVFVATFLASSTLSRLVAPAPSGSAETPTTMRRTEDAVSATDRRIGALQERLRQQPDDAATATQSRAGVPAASTRKQ